MARGEIENITSPADSVTILSLGVTIPAGVTESIDEDYASTKDWHNASTELESLITAGDIEIRTEQDIVIQSGGVSGWIGAQDAEVKHHEVVDFLQTVPSTDKLIVHANRQMILHGDFNVDGDLFLEGQLILETDYEPIGFIDYIQISEELILHPRRQMILHGPFIVDGSLLFEGGQLILETDYEPIGFIDYIQPSEELILHPRRQMTIHGPFIVDGVLLLEGGKLINEN